ncbi:short-chain fatty acid transporter [Caldinitratiruptor microaerophilus]|uniref:Short-chain fatty acids transporter n=1 Tax=Caldinitratiruptor microaerophilus TaxID=671077 RepID=A0AA35GAA7_9FIRM|nr:TIGR00366 family protein [Caldinitratiruptor microaerophilus]BDG62313.1 short-chain fatty acids transporter [Caldinitratiruptor microaerophilus]
MQEERHAGWTAAAQPERIPFVATLATAATRWSTRWVPDAYVLAILLTVLASVLALTFTPSTLPQLVEFWGRGFWELLSFSMQMSLIIFTGYVVAVAPPVSRLLDRLAALARTPRGAVALMAVVSMALGLVNWGFSIVGSAVFVRFLAKRVRNVDYRLLVAAAYLGLGTTWHAGLSASAPLLVATPKHFLEKDIGIIPVTQTIFHPFNLVLVLIVIVAMALLTPALHPGRDETVTVDPAVLAEMEEFTPPARTEYTPATALEYSPLVNWLIGLAGIAYLLLYFRGKGLAAININVVNFIFLTLGILLHSRPASLLKAAEEAGRYVWGVVLQFPFYAGIFGIVQYSGLSDQIGNWFVSFATKETYPAIVYWYSGLLNYIVPSGGSKWAIEAPYIMKAGAQLGVPNALTVLSYAWGDMMTDIIQPFWAIPLLSVAKLRFRDIMGFAVVIFLVYAVLTSVAFLAAPLFFR